MIVPQLGHCMEKPPIINRRPSAKLLLAVQGSAIVLKLSISIRCNYDHFERSPSARQMRRLSVFWALRAQARSLRTGRLRHHPWHELCSA